MSQKIKIIFANSIPAQKKGSLHNIPKKTGVLSGF